MREAGEIRGPVRIGAGHGAVRYLLPEPVRKFRRRYPGIDVIIRNQPVEESFAMLRSGELDFALRSVGSPLAGFDYVPSKALTFDRVVIAARQHPLRRVRTLTPVLAEYPFVMPWKHSTTRQIVEGKLAEVGLTYRVALEAGGWEIIKTYVRLGLGIAAVPKFCLTAGDAQHLVARPLPRLFGRDRYGVVVKQGRRLTQAARALIARIDASIDLEAARPSGGRRNERGCRPRPVFRAATPPTDAPPGRPPSTYAAQSHLIEERPGV